MKTQEFVKESMQRHNARSLAGLTLRNANGDIDTTALGYQIAIDTLTFIKKQVTEQKFYEIPVAEYVPVAVGDGVFAQNILTNLAVNTSGKFEEGIINQGIGNDRLAIADAGISSKTIKVVNWAKAVGYSIFDIEQALQANNWDLIESKHRARKKNWDLGIQEMAFLGSLHDAGVLGLYTQTAVTADTSVINQSLSSSTANEFAAIVAGLLAAYQANCNFTAMPTHFIIPQDDYLGLVAPVSNTYPFNSKLEYLKKAFAEIVPGGVKVLPCVYGIASINKSRLNGGSGKDRYVMYRHDAESIRMDIPVDFTVTQPNTLNNFQFQDAAYGQFTGVGVYRNLEILYFDI